MRKIQSQKGFSLLELSIVLTIGLFVSALALEDKATEYAKEKVKTEAHHAVKYAQGVADFLSVNPNAAAAVNTGSAWLKDKAICGIAVASGTYAHLPCLFPDTLGLGLGAPKVTIDDTGPISTAVINFGTIDTSLHVTPGLAAADLANYANAITEDNLNSYINFVKEDPNPGAPVGNVVANIDMINNNIYLRTDGTGFMSGKLKMQDTAITAHDDWAIIGTDSTGSLNSAAKSSVSSANFNDVYIRSEGVWLSETHQLALDAFDLATEAKAQSDESLRFVTVASHGDVINKPTCSAGLTPQFFSAQANVVTDTVNPQPLSGLEAWAIDNGASWTVQLRAFDPSAGGGTGAWVDVDSTRGSATIFIKCSS